ncbi:unnamed protein product [Acanthosepion pharaonis]|uniref:Uncharacterized protein n=1 Tax=Acanthosepion pharaonis TaxID=158019 RepID=A0A812CT32_ACAPH|nr:unnamed protein product [Sepia pharaonis]
MRPTSLRWHLGNALGRPSGRTGQSVTGWWAEWCDAHERINEIPTVPTYYLAKPQPRERAWNDQRGKKTLLSFPLHRRETRLCRRRKHGSRCGCGDGGLRLGGFASRRSLSASHFRFLLCRAGPTPSSVGRRFVRPGFSRPSPRPASFGVVEPEIPPLPSLPRSPGEKGDGSLGGPLASAKGAGSPPPDWGPRSTLSRGPCRAWSLTRAVRLSNGNAGVPRRAQRGRKPREAKGQKLARSRFSVRIRTAKAWPIDPFRAESSVPPRGVRKVTTGITGFWRPSVRTGTATGAVTVLRKASLFVPLGPAVADVVVARGGRVRRWRSSSATSAAVASHAATSVNGPPDLTSATGGILPSPSYFEPPVERETRGRS